MLERVLLDLRYSGRLLRKSPGFTAAAVLVLALGIGANTAIFSVVDVLLFRPLPVTAPDRLVRIFNGQHPRQTSWGFVSLPSYQEYRDHADAFAGLAAYTDRFPANVSTSKTGAERVDAGMVTGNYFQVLGAKGYMGRSLSTEDDRAEAPPVVMLGFNFWRRHFSQDSSTLGAQILIDGQPFTVVGVTPEGFGGVDFSNFPDIWIPLSYGIKLDPLLRSQIPLNRESFAVFGVVGRLRAGVPLSQAQAQLDALATRMGAGKSEEAEGQSWKRPWPVLVPVTEAATQEGKRLSLLLLGIVSLVLLIACADVSGLLLARSENRQKEIALRLALGAPRHRIIRLNFAEGLWISLMGAVFGCVFAAAASRLLLISTAADLPLPLGRSDSLLDVRVLVFTALVGMVAGLLSTVFPALKYSRSELALGIKSDSVHAGALSRRFSMQSGLVVLQIAASTILLIGSGLMIRTLWNASRVHLGFNTSDAGGASTDFIRQGYDKEKAANLLEPLLDSLRREPGIQSAALGPLPMQGDYETMARVEGYDSAQAAGEWIQLRLVSPGYFATLGIPFFTGRDFNRSDFAGAPGAAVISQSMATKYWPHQSPLGKHVDHVGPHDKIFEVVGVVGDTAGNDLRRAPGSVVYLPLAQSYLMFPWQPDVTLLARSSLGTDALVSSLRRAVAAINPALPLFHVRTFEQQADNAFGQERFLARLLTLFAALALLLSMAGVFGLVAYSTARATRDFGIRIALGAPSYHVLWTVLRRGLALSGVGLALGLVIALWSSRLLSSLLLGVTPGDPGTLIGIGLLLLLITLLACSLPAWRATRVDPVIALRNE